MTERKQQDQDKFIVRLPEGMRDRIKAAADRNNRSMNAEIVATLLEQYPELSNTEAMVRVFIRRLEMKPQDQRIEAMKQIQDILYPEDKEASERQS